MDNSVFFYVDGIPTKGCWIDLTEFHDWDDIAQELADKGYIPKNEAGEPDYGGDILAADGEGVMRHFVGSYGTFDLESAKELLSLEGKFDQGALEAAVYLMPDNFVRLIKEDYCGHFERATDLAYDRVEESGMLSDVPEYIAMYFDYEAYGRDLAIEMWEHDGHYFYSR